MTALDICNMALGYIAKQRIISLEDNNESARQCKLFYDHLRKILLRDYNWNFSKKHSSLPMVDKSIKGWAHCYVYPNDCLAIRFLYNDSGAATKEFNRTEFDTCITDDNIKIICTNIKDAKLEYTADIVNSDLMSSDFIEAFARLLASNLSLALTGNPGIADGQYQFFQLALQRARIGNFYEQQKDVHFPQGYAEARL